MLKPIGSKLSLVTRPSTPPAFDRLQYAKTETAHGGVEGHVNKAIASPSSA